MESLNLIYREIPEKRTKTTRHYELESGDSKQLLSNQIRLVNDRGYASNSRPDYWLFEYIDRRYKKSPSTGLFKIPVSGMAYSGDLIKKSHLVTFAIVGERIDIKIRVNYYPFDTRKHPRTIANLITKI